MSVDDRFISAYDIGSLVCVSDGKRVFEGSSGDSMLSYEGPIDAVDLGSRVNDCGGVDVFHSEGGNDEFHFNIQRILSSRGAMNNGREFLRRSGFPF